MTAFSQLYKLVPALLLFSLVSNLAILISPIFMMQVLDRVIPSGNVNTLVLLSGLAAAALLLQSVVEGARDMSLGRLGRWAEREGAALALAPGRANSQEVIDKVGSVAGFLGGSLAPVALSIPWLPVFVLALLMLHPAFAGLVLGLVGLAFAIRHVADTLSAPDLRRAADHARAEKSSLDNAAQFSSRTGIAVIARNLRDRYRTHQEAKLACQDRAQRPNVTQSAALAMLRSLAQILALALGAYLVTQDALSAGGMIAASIITAKSYATFETAIAQQGAIRQALRDLHALATLPATQSNPALDISEMSGRLRAEALVVPRGQGKPPRLDRVSFALEPGQCLVIVGGSGSGKTTLLHALAGIDPAPIGSVFLDESEIRGLPDIALHRHTGFLQQQAVLLPGTLAENIACFTPDAPADQIVEAARNAGVHGLISALPESYDSDMGSQPYLLSAGQKQRIALARAIFASPRYLFLDEPNALLDAEGERALGQTLSRLKRQGVTIVMTLHRSGVMGIADKVMRLESGRMADFGDRTEVLGRMMANKHQIEVPLLESSLQDLTDWIAARFTRTSDAEFSQKAQLVGTELFNVACRNAQKSDARSAKFIFSFKDDTNCELKMVEEGASDAEAKMMRIRKMLKDPSAEMWKLPRDEVSLATVDQLSARFEISNMENYALYAAALNMPNPEMARSNQRRAPQGGHA
jgi:ABC-type protease/lipase transport system fused ATPase/permease subunit